MKEPNAMLTEEQAGVKGKLLNMGNIWRIYMQKGRTSGEEGMEIKDRKRGSQRNRVLTEVERVW